MNFIEAYKTGRPFRRRGWHGYVIGIMHRPHEPLTANAVNPYWKSENGKIRHACNAEELLANDWEVMEQSVTISKDQFYAAMSLLPYTPNSNSSFDIIADIVWRELVELTTQKEDLNVINELFPEEACSPYSSDDCDISN